jgi:hypothetical protein
MNMIRLVFRLAVLILFAFSLKAVAENTASGTLTLNGSGTELKHAYVDEGGSDLILVLTDKTVASGDIPFGLNNLAVEDNVRAIVFTISKETKELTPGLNAIYHPICEGQLGTIGNGVLTLSKLDNNEIAGKISTPNENTFSNYKFSYEVSFAAKLGQPEKTAPLTVEIQGADDPPSKAYAEYYRALMSGDKDELRKHLASEILKEADEETISIVIELTQTMNPTTLKIMGSEVKGNEALLKAEGFRDGQKSIGSIQMKLEDGAWKVVKDSWDGKMN